MNALHIAKVFDRVACHGVLICVIQSLLQKIVVPRLEAWTSNGESMKMTHCLAKGGVLSASY